MEDNEYYVYVHLLDNIPFYIGYGKGRRAENLWARKRRWKEYVKDRIYDVEIQFLKTNLSEEKAKELEIEYQKQYKQLGYPIVGLVGNIQDSESIERMSKKLKGQKRTEEQKEHYKIAMKKRMENGFKPPSWKGRRHTKETKEKLSKMRKGKSVPNLKGEKNGMWGKHSPNAKKVDVYLNGNFIKTFNNTYDAEKFTGVISCRNYANGNAGTHLHKKSGYSFYYKDRKDK